MVDSKQDEKLSFEQALARLQHIIEQLDEGNIPLERALGLYQEGVKMASYCRLSLDNAQERLELLRMAEDGKVEFDEFELPAKRDD